MTARTREYLVTVPLLLMAATAATARLTGSLSPACDSATWSAAASVETAFDPNGPLLRAGYLRSPRDFLDAWGRPMRYRCPGRHNPDGYDLWSVGPDGIDGTADDITNWDD